MASQRATAARADEFRTQRQQHRDLWDRLNADENLERYHLDRCQYAKLCRCGLVDEVTKLVFAASAYDGR